MFTFELHKVTRYPLNPYLKGNLACLTYFKMLHAISSKGLQFAEKHSKDIANFVDKLASPTVSQQHLTPAEVRPQLGVSAAAPLQDEPVWQRKKQMRMSGHSGGQNTAPNTSPPGVIKDLPSPLPQSLHPPKGEGLSQSLHSAEGGKLSPAVGNDGCMGRLFVVSSCHFQRRGLQKSCKKLQCPC